MFCLSTSVRSHVLYMRRPSWPTHNKMYVTRSACSLSRNGPLKISSQYCLNDLNSVGRSAANQFIRGGSIPESSPMAIMGVFNNSQCVNTASLFNVISIGNQLEIIIITRNVDRLCNACTGTVHWRGYNRTSLLHRRGDGKYQPASFDV